MANEKLSGDDRGDLVYQALKARAIAFRFGAGNPIRLRLLAAELGVSTTPIRAALNRLVAEGLVVRAPRKGFIAMSIYEDRFTGLYRLNQHLLAAALTVRRAGAEMDAETASSIARIGNAMDNGEQGTADATAGYTGQLFSCIARRSGNPHVVEAVGRINDSLRYVRALENEQLVGVPGELVNICELFLAERLDELGDAIAHYHARRLTLLPTLLAKLRK